MTLPEPFAAHFRRQAQACDALGSPFTGRLCRLLADLLDDATATGRRVLAWEGDPRADALALRLCGGLHRLVIEGRDPPLAAAYPPNEANDNALSAAVAGALKRHDAALCAGLASAPQTNEIARSAMLLPGFLAAARETGRPLALAEIGASGGLNLLFDRFCYAYGDERWGDPASPVQLAPEVRGTTPVFEGALSIDSRNGCDIAPVDARSQEGKARLRSYVWPDQPLRLRRLDGALQLAQKHRFSLHEEDAAAFVARQLSRRVPGTTFVLFHSIMWQYLPRQTRDAILDTMAQAGKAATPDAPLAHLRMEPQELADPYATLSLTLWPGSTYGGGETRHLAKCDYHGRWIEWTA